MAPGQRQDLTRIALQQAQKSAEALFESKSIADIKKVRSVLFDHSLNSDFGILKTELDHSVPLNAPFT